MKPSDSEQDVVWKLELPDVAGLYWERDFSDKEVRLIRVFERDGNLFVGRRVMGHPSINRFDAYRQFKYGHVAYCGPDRAPPVV
jgi:hypothetical protein